jgi:hypothetical protein
MWDDFILLVPILAAGVISTWAQEWGENQSFSYEKHRLRGKTRTAPCRTRTCDPRIRNPLLYPAELRAQFSSDSGRYYVSGQRRGKEIYDRNERATAK